MNSGKNADMEWTRRGTTHGEDVPYHSACDFLISKYDDDQKQKRCIESMPITARAQTKTIENLITGGVKPK